MQSFCIPCCCFHQHNPHFLPNPSSIPHPHNIIQYQYTVCAVYTVIFQWFQIIVSECTIRYLELVKCTISLSNLPYLTHTLRTSFLSSCLQSQLYVKSLQNATIKLMKSYNQRSLILPNFPRSNCPTSLISLYSCNLSMWVCSSSSEYLKYYTTGLKSSFVAWQEQV